MEMDSTEAAQNIWCLWTKAAAEVYSRQTDAVLGLFPGCQSCKLQTLKLCLQIFPASQGAAPHSPPMITAAVGIIKTSFLSLLDVSCKDSPTTTHVSSATPSVTAGCGIWTCSSLVTQSTPVVVSTITL